MPRLRLQRDPTQFRELIDTRITAEAPVARSPNSTKRHLRLIVHRWAVDMADAGTNLACYTQATGHVTGKHSGRKSVLAVVGETNRISLILCMDHSYDRTEAFLAIDI